MLNDWYENIMLAITLFTFVIQFYVLYLINFVSPTVMKEYTWFLNWITFYDTCFNFALGIMFEPISLNSMFESIALSPIVGSKFGGLANKLGFQACLISAAVAYFCFVAVVSMQDYALIYRFLILYSPRLRHLFMTIWGKIIFLIITHGIPLSLSIGFYMCMLQPDEYIDFFNNSPKVPLTEPKLQITDHAMVLSEKPFFLKYVAIVLATFIFGESLAFGLLYAIFKILKRNSAIYSKQTYRMHLQFTLLLFAQFLSPLILLFAPVAILLVIILNQKPGNLFIVQLGFIGFSIYGTLNTLFNILLITPYRRHFLSTFITPFFNRLSKNRLFATYQIGMTIAQGTSRVSGISNAGSSRVGQEF